MPIVNVYYARTVTGFMHRPNERIMLQRFRGYLFIFFISESAMGRECIMSLGICIVTPLLVGPVVKWAPWVLMGDRVGTGAS